MPMASSSSSSSSSSCNRHNFSLWQLLLSPKLSQMPMMIFLLLLHLLQFVQLATAPAASGGGANVLFTFYHDRGSHFGSMLPFMERLAIAGHNVHVLDTIFPADKSPLIRHIRTPLPQDDETEEARLAFHQFYWEETDTAVTLPEFFTHGDDKLGLLMANYSEKFRLAQQHSVTVLYTISSNPPAKLAESGIRPVVAPLPHMDEDGRMIAPFIWNLTVNSQILMAVFGEGDHQMSQLNELHSQKVAQIVDTDWDVIVMDDLFWCFGFSSALLKQRLWEKGGGGGGKAPEPRSIVYATAGQTLLSAESIKATSRNWVSKVPLFPYMPTDEKDVFSPARFPHRLFAFYENFAEHLLMNLLVENFMLPNITKFGVPNFSWYEMYRRSSLQMSDSIDRMGWPMAIGPEMINVGAHCKEAQGLPEEFRKFVEDPRSKGTIYAAFGTYPEWSLAPARILTALIGAFQRLTDYRIIFSYNGPPIAGIGQHIMLAKWAPQLEILAHPKTKAYITHGGLKSVREGLCAGVPLIVMPMFAEQAHNAHLVLAMGIGPVINKYSLTADSVHGTINQVVSNEESVVRAHRFRAIFLDRPMAPLDEGAFWVDRLMRLKPGRRANFVRKGMDLGWLQFGYADLGALLIVLILIGAKL